MENKSLWILGIALLCLPLVTIVVSAEPYYNNKSFYKTIFNSTINNFITLDIGNMSEMSYINFTLSNTTYSENLLFASTLNTGSTIVGYWNASSTLGKNVEYRLNLSVRSNVTNNTYNYSLGRTAYTPKEIYSLTLGSADNPTGLDDNNTVTINYSTKLNMSATFKMNSSYTIGKIVIDVFLFNESIISTGSSGSANLGVVLLIEDFDVVDRPVSTYLSWKMMDMYYNPAVVTALNLNESTIKVQFYNSTCDCWQNDASSSVNTTRHVVTTNNTHLTLQQIVADPLPIPPPPAPQSQTPTSSSNSGSSNYVPSSSVGSIGGFIEKPKAKWVTNWTNETLESNKTAFMLATLNHYSTTIINDDGDILKTPSYPKEYLIVDVSQKSVQTNYTDIMYILNLLFGWVFK